MGTRLASRALVVSALAVLTLAGSASALEVGQKAPDFALNGVDGKPVKLSDMTAKGPVVIFTFIAAFTPHLNEGTDRLRGGPAAVRGPGVPRSWA